MSTKVNLTIKVRQGLGLISTLIEGKDFGVLNSDDADAFAKAKQYIKFVAASSPKKHIPGSGPVPSQLKKTD